MWCQNIKPDITNTTTVLKASMMPQLLTLPLVSAPHREISGGLHSTAVIPQHRRGGCPIPSNVPECSDSHELETLMPPGSQKSGQPLVEAPEEQSLMASANPGEGEDAPAPEPKVKTCKGRVHFQMSTGYSDYFCVNRGIIIQILTHSLCCSFCRLLGMALWVITGPTESLDTETP